MIIRKRNAVSVWVYRAIPKEQLPKVFLGVGIAALITIFIVAAALLISAAAQPTAVAAAKLGVRDLTNGARAVRVNGFGLWYREVGPRKPSTRPVVLVIHGGPGMSDHYYNGAFDFLKDRFRVVYYDQRGSGFSQIKPNLKNYQFSDLVDEVEGLRSHVIHAEKLILVAHSFGGLVAMGYATTHPEHVAGLVLISSMTPRDYTVKSPDGPEFDDWLVHEKPADADRLILQSYLSSIGDTLYDPDSKVVPNVGYMSYAPARMFWYSATGWNFVDGLQKLNIPSLVIYGAADTIAPSVPIQLHALLKGSYLVRFETSGHWSFLEEPLRFKEVINTFFSASWP